MLVLSSVLVLSTQSLNADDVGGIRMKISWA